MTSEKIIGFPTMKEEIMKYRCLECGALLMEDQIAEDCPYCSQTNIVELVPVISVEDELIFLDKVLERLSGYHCGQHKQLEKMILNRKRKVKHNE